MPHAQRRGRPERPYPNPCPDPATLGAVTPDYNPDFPINSISCSQGWAVGFYEAHGKNQTTGSAKIGVRTGNSAVRK